MAETRILDQYGNPARLNTDRIGQPDQWGEFRVPRRTRENLTPPNVSAILRRAQRGDPRSQAELFEQMLDSDGRLPGNFGTRTKAVAKLDWELTAASDDEADQKVVEWLRPRLQALRLHNVLQRLARAVGYGYGAEQIMWELRGSDLEVIEIKHWPTRYLMPDAEGTINHYTTADSLMPTPMPAAKFIVHTPGELNSDPSTAGLLRPAAWFWFFKRFALKAWLMFTERYGQPFRVGKYPPGMSTQEKDDAFMALVRMGAEAVAMMPDSVEVEFHQVAAAMHGEAYSVLADRCDAEISILLLGQTLSTSVGKNGGALATAKVHEEVRQDIVDWDAKQLAETIERDLITPWVRFQFGGAVQIPQFELEVDNPVDLEKRSKVLDTAARFGLPIATRTIYEELQIPAPADDDELLEVPAASSAPPDRAPPQPENRRLGKHDRSGTGTRPDDWLI